MERLRSFIGHISNYLLGKETPSERQDLYEWYDDMAHSDVHTEEERARIALNAKRRILASIRPTREGRRISYQKWAGIAASVLLTLGIVYWLTFKRVDYRIASIAELADLTPGREHAIVVLPSGETVDLDSIPLKGSVQIGHTVISRNESGEITYLSTEKETNPMYILQTPRSATSEIILSDGTRVLLNADSRLHYPARFEQGDRIVRLEGEGYFQVTKTAHKSRFIVQTEDQDIQVLGTKFNVKAYGENHATWTTLEEGSVQVASRQESHSKLILTPGQQAVQENGSLSARYVDIESVLGWTKGVFYFDGTNTADVLRQIEQWYDIDIAYRENKTMLQYSGKIPRNLSLDKLIDLLSYADFRVESRINKQNRINLIIN